MLPNRSVCICKVIYYKDQGKTCSKSGAVGAESGHCDDTVIAMSLGIQRQLCPLTQASLELTHGLYADSREGKG